MSTTEYMPMCVEHNVKNFVKNLEMNDFNRYNTLPVSDFRAGLRSGLLSFLKMQGLNDTDCAQALGYFHTFMVGDQLT